MAKKAFKVQTVSQTNDHGITSQTT